MFGKLLDTLEFVTDLLREFSLHDLTYVGLHGLGQRREFDRVELLSLRPLGESSAKGCLAISSWPGAALGTCQGGEQQYTEQANRR